MKVVNIIRKVVVGLITTIFYAFALAMTILVLNYNDYGITVFGDTSLILMDKKLSKDFSNYDAGDLVIVEKKEINDIKVGDEIFAYAVNNKGEANVTLGIVGATYPSDKAISFENGTSFSEEYIIGGFEKKYGSIGSVLSVVESKWGFLFIVLVPGFILFIYELYALIVEIKYPEEEETPVKKEVKPKKK